jgi:hypothetical protein
MPSQEHMIDPLHTADTDSLIVLFTLYHKLLFMIGVVCPECGGSMSVRNGGTFLPDLTDYHYRSQHLALPQEPRIAKSHTFH